ncbi:MAG: type II secretion system F family protein [Gammaproteobacteria bacterium]
MANYQYKAMNEEGRLVRGELIAKNEWDLDARLSELDLELVTCKPNRESAMIGRRKTSRKELINFCFHLEQSHRAGLPILESLRDLRDSTDDVRFRGILASLTSAIEGGSNLSSALREFPQTFDEVFVALIEAGENSGELDTVLQQMVETLKWQDEITSQTKKLLMYPSFVGAVVLAVMGFLMIYVVPQMTDFLETMEKDMPFYTVMLIATSNFIANYWYIVLGVPVAGFIALKTLQKTNARFAWWLDYLKLHVWVFGDILKKIIMSRFATYFTIMYASGITVLDSLESARKLSGNRVVGDAIEKVAARVSEGSSLSESVRRSGLFPQLVVRMIKMGEDVGQLDKSLLNVTYFYNREVEEAVDRMQRMIEPIMTVILGLLLGWVMMSVLSPIYDTIAEMGL